MLRNEILELYKYHSNKDLVDSFSIIKQDRKTIALYDFGDVKWILMPDNHSDITKEELDSYKKKESTKIMFLKDGKLLKTSSSGHCWKLSLSEDKEGFDAFYNACSNDDKESGQVSLNDPVVYGLFEKGKIVSVASLLNWGDELCDIGVLTHPRYRHKGYAKDVCVQLMNDADKLYIWRCDTKNDASFELAKELGFEVYGSIDIVTK